MPMVFNAMKDVIYAELNKEYSCEEYFVDEWQRRRKTLCYGYCAVLRMGRKLGFASIQDVVSITHERAVLVLFHTSIADSLCHTF